jgi:hypothetical protein
MRYFSLFIMLIYSLQGVAMTLIFGGEKIEAVLFSPLEGQVTFNGKPAAGAKLKLWLAWKDQAGGTEVFYADQNGYFSIPKKVVQYRQNPLAQISIGQTVTAEYQGRDYLIWKGGKSSTHLYGELGGKPIQVTCELTEDEMQPFLEHALVETICQWKSLEKI